MLTANMLALVCCDGELSDLFTVSRGKVFVLCKLCLLCEAGISLYCLVVKLESLSSGCYVGKSQAEN